ncbi:MAG: 3-deoxy-7-phosphoheptulonate synthase [Bdellovibrionaceae bacterium]|nr:3-deoxy-7-phosphoheptulonate synthase [Pseudobdellovibrionaceae bacterium]
MMFSNITDTKISKKIVEIVSGNKNLSIGGGSFCVIAGPCSIENELQFSSTANFVTKNGAQLLRGGVWKPRTSHKSFQGLGSVALELVKKITTETNQGIVSEVMDPRDIEELYPYVSLFQVGSRNMHNYSLLKELAQQDKPVLLKRGFASFVDEWIKSAEYIEQGGKASVILCERGIRTFETVTRNTLDLNSVAFIKHKTHYPIIVDPSHGVGVSLLVPDLALAAAALGADGIMVEVHPNPKEALSDGPQALTFPQFEILMTKINRIIEIVGQK